MANGAIAARLRRLLGANQGYLASRVGVSVMTISRFERCDKIPTPTERVIFEELDILSKTLDKDKLIFYKKERALVDEYWFLYR